MKFILYSIISLLLVSCATSKIYVEPVGENAATITISPIRNVEGELNEPLVLVWIDDLAVIENERFPQQINVFRVSPGSHELKLRIIAYNNTRQKVNEIALGITIQELKIYNLSIDIPERPSRIGVDMTINGVVADLHVGLMLANNLPQQCGVPDITSHHGFSRLGGWGLCAGHIKFDYLDIESQQPVRNQFPQVAVASGDECCFNW